MKFNPANATPTLRLTLQVADYALRKYQRAHVIAFPSGTQFLPFAEQTDLEIIAARFSAETPEKVARIHNIVCGVHRRPELKEGFTELVSALRAELISDDASHDEISAWSAPDECHDDATRCHRKEVERLLDVYDFTSDEIYAEADRRGVSKKWMYQNVPQTEWDY